MEKYYDPDRTPDSKEWLALRQEEKIRLVEQYHRKNGIRCGNRRLHALIHVTVENHIALGHQIPVKATLLKLLYEGLSRHEAIHTIGIVFRKHLRDAGGNPTKQVELGATDYEELEQLTAEDLLNSFDDED